MDHLRTKMNAKCANNPDPKPIAQNPKRNYKADQKNPSPLAGQEQIGCDQAGQNEHDAGANPASGFSNLFVGRTRNAFLEINQPRGDKDRMSVGVNKTRRNHLIFAVDLDDVLAVFLKPSISETLLRGADRHNFAGIAENGGTFDNSEFFEIPPAARTRLA